MTKPSSKLSIPSYIAGIILSIILITIIQYEWNKHENAQVTNQPATGMPAPMLSGVGAPSSFFTCGNPFVNMLFVNSSATVTTGRFWLCDGTNWNNLPNTVTYYLNNTAQPTARCDFLLGTTNGAGSFTFDYTAMGFSSIIGQPQPSVQASPGTVSLTSFSTTGATVNATVGTVITILTINIVSFGGAALPVGLFVCGV